MSASLDASDVIAEARALRASGQLGAAAARLRDLTRRVRNPGLEAIEALASVRRALGDVDRAIEAYHELRALQPESETAVIALAVLIAIRDGELAGVRLLERWARAYGMTGPVRAQLGRLLFLARRALDPAAARERDSFRAQIAAIKAELAANPLFEPSVFWQRHIAMHEYLLERYGLDSFKRTVTHNYQNWLMCSVDDPQVKRLMEFSSTSFPTAETPTLPVDDVGFHYIFAAEQFPSEPPVYNLIESGPYAGGVLYPHYPLSEPGAARIYGDAVRALWRHTASRFPATMARLYESEIGNPIPVRDGERLISSDLCHSVREQGELFAASGLDGSEGLVVAELGAGQGRLAELYGRNTNYRYWIFDIAPALAVSEWYVRRLFPDQPVFGFRHFDRYEEIASELAASRFAFFTPNQLSLLPDRSCDVFVNINSLMEMLPEQIRHFLAEIARVTSRYFYCKQWVEWTNGIDGVSVKQSDFDLGTGWRAIASQRDEIYPAFFTTVWAFGA